MAAVTRLNQWFQSGGKREVPHAPTEGMAWMDQIEKAGNSARAIFSDWWYPLKKVDDYFDPQSPEARMITTSLERRATYFGKDTFLTFYNALSAKYPKAPVQFFSQGILHETLPDKVFEREIVLTENLLAYPFVYSSSSFFSAPHIVLILVERGKKEIYYYDSRGLTSDDPTYIHYKMHESLIALGRSLFKEAPFRVIENRARHQVDSMSCGVFVATALKRLFEGESIPEALNFGNTLEVALALRQQMGQFYLGAAEVPHRPEPRLEEEDWDL